MRFHVFDPMLCKYIASFATLEYAEGFCSRLFGRANEDDDPFIVCDDLTVFVPYFVDGTHYFGPEYVRFRETKFTEVFSRILFEES